MDTNGNGEEPDAVSGPGGAPDPGIPDHHDPSTVRQPGFWHGQLTRADWADLDPLSTVLTEAFHGLAPSKWLIPDPVARLETFPGYFRIFLDHAMTNGAVFTTTHRIAVALWLHAGEGWDKQPVDYDQRLAAATGGWVDRFRTFDAVLDKHHPTGLRHDHLAMLAVQPAWQGEGIASALLDSYHQMLDRDDVRVPAYLEASDRGTRRLYLAHGYTDHGTAIHLPDGPTMYPMLRRQAPPPPPRSTP